MFDHPNRPLNTADLEGMRDALGCLDQVVDDAVRIDRIRVLEELKSAVAAAQADETAAFVASQREQQAAHGVPEERVGRGIAAQVALAKRTSPYHARRYVGWAQILTSELPRTFAELAAGRITDWRAMLVARETIWLSRAHRGLVDAELAPQLESLGDRRVEAEAKKLGYRLDPEGYVARVRAAENDRRVGLRPAPDTMARLTSLLPVAQGVAAYAALKQEADSLISQGDQRSRGQIMADTLVERLTGQASAGDVPIEINLVMTDEALFNVSSEDGAGADEPAHLDGYGPLPAGLARRLIFEAGDATPMWLRRLFTRPDTGELAVMDSRRRFFGGNQRHFIRLRDQFCRTPWCGAPIRHIDHVRPVIDGGATDTENGDGYCEACNYAKQAAGWQTNLVPNPSGHEIEIITPTGHRYRSRQPDPPGTSPRRRRSPLERRAAALVPRAA